MHCERVSRARPLLGTLVEISLAGRDANALHDAANAAFDAIESIHEIMSFHLPDSDVTRLNNSAVGSTVRVDPRTWRVIETANEIASASGGVFDITVGGAMMARGDLPFMQSRSVDRDASYRDIELLSDSRVRILRPLAIDVGGIAKGYAVDCAVSILQDAGVVSGCVNAGGDLRVFGDEATPVAVRDPLKPEVAGALVNLRDCAFATSASYAADSGAAGMVLDPRDNAPVIVGHSASVRAKTCMIADALAKCVLILAQESGTLLRRYGADGFMLGSSGSVQIDTRSRNTQVRDDDQMHNASVPGPLVECSKLTGTHALNVDSSDASRRSATQ